MDYFLSLRMLHILAAVVVAGTGTGIAFFMFVAWRSRKPVVIAHTARIVVLADWIFTAPAVLIQLVSGVLLMQRLGYSFSSDWFIRVAGLFVFIGLCWIPVVVIQYRLREVASRMTDRVAPEFDRLMKYWVALGVPAFSAILVVFWLMVFRPYPVY